jgi:hypothetical protein
MALPHARANPNASHRHDFMMLSPVRIQKGQNFSKKLVPQPALEALAMSPVPR